MLELKVGSASDSMNWLEFISSLTDSLAWPIAAFAIAFLFRQQIASLLKRLDEIGFGDAKAKFTKELDKAEQKAEALPPVPLAPDGEPDQVATNLSEEDRFESLLAIAPSAAILDTWTGIERELQDLAYRHGITEPKLTRSPSMLVHELHKGGLLPPSVVTMLAELQKIRNLAAHAREVTAGDALRFRELAERVNAVLNTLRP